MRVALALWGRDAPEALRPSIRRALGRVALGDAPARALQAELAPSLGDDASALGALLALHSSLGVDLARLVDAGARAIDARAELRAAAEAATSGVRLSGRVVAALPLPLVAAAALWGAPLFDAGGLALLVGGLVLETLGLLWIERLVPAAPRRDDPAAVVADCAASALRAGATTALALSIAARHAPAELREPLWRAQRIVALGATWPQALQRAGDDSVETMARVLQSAHDAGLPVAAALETFACARRDALARAHERAVRRGAVVMVVPLTLVVLPAFVLLGLGPFLRALSLAW